MTTPDYKSVSLPVGMILRIDDFLDSSYSKELGLSSRADLIKELLNRFFEDLDAKKREKRY